MSRRVQSVAVVGRDAPLWLTALGLQRAFGRVGVQVTAVELPTAMGEAEVYVATPTLSTLHQLLGIDEDDVLAACAGVYALGQRWTGWSNTAPPFMHAYDRFGAPFENVDFIHYWLRARAKGLPVALEEFSLGAAAAKQGRVIVHTHETESLSKAAHGYHLDARGYSAFLKGRALRAGVVGLRGPVEWAKVEGERVCSLDLPGGEAVAADLFVDVSAEGLLIDSLPGSGFESWKRWLPCDRILSISGRRMQTLPSFSQISALEVGWIGTFPLQDRTAFTAVYASNVASDQQVLAGLTTAGLGLSGQASVTAFSAGARTRPWIGNCVAVGEAAVRLEPLDAAPMQLLQVALAHLVALFPVDADNLLEASIYNREFRAYADNIRNFQLAHYKLNGRVGEPLWDRARGMEVPEGLAHKLKLFGARGRVALYDNETFDEATWISMFVGHGVAPRSYDPLADRVPDEDLPRKLQELLDFIGEQINGMPSVEAQLEIAMPSQGSGFF